MTTRTGVVAVDTAPGDERIVRAAVERADAIVIPTRAGGVEPTRVASTLEMVPPGTPAGVVVCAARRGTFDLAETSPNPAPRSWRCGWCPNGSPLRPDPRVVSPRESMDAYGEIYRPGSSQSETVRPRPPRPAAERFLLPCCR